MRRLYLHTVEDTGESETLIAEVQQLDLIYLNDVAGSAIKSYSLLLRGMIQTTSAAAIALHKGFCPHPHIELHSSQDPSPQGYVCSACGRVLVVSEGK